MSKNKPKADREINSIGEFHAWALDMHKRVLEFESDFDQPNELKRVINECLEHKKFDEVLLQEKIDYIEAANSKRMITNSHFFKKETNDHFLKIKNFKKKVTDKLGDNATKELIEECQKNLSSLSIVPDTNHEKAGLIRLLATVKEVYKSSDPSSVWVHLYNFDTYYKANSKRLKLKYKLKHAEVERFKASIEKKRRNNTAEGFLNICQKSYDLLKVIPNLDEGKKELELLMNSAKLALNENDFDSLWVYLYDYHTQHEREISRFKAIELDSKGKEVIEQRKIDASYSKKQGHEETIQNFIIKYIDKGRDYPMKTLKKDIDELELKDHKGGHVTFSKTTLEKYIKQYKETGKITT